MTWQQVVLLAAIHILGERMKVLIKKSIASLLTIIVLKTNLFIYSITKNELK